MHKISIIVPIYNAQIYLPRCIDSILSQTFRKFELILVNDGSTDKCNKICESYREKDNRIKVINKKNGGVSSARNAGIDIATGEFIGFVDPDDYLDSDALEYLYDLAIQNSADIAAYRMKTYKNNMLKSQEVYDENIQIYSGEEIIKEYATNGTFLYSSCNKIYSRKLFEGEFNRFEEDIRYAEDALFNYYMLSKSNKLIYSNLQKYNYCINSGSAVNSVTEKRIDILRAQRKIYYLLKKKYNNYTQPIIHDYIKSSILIPIDIANEKSIIRKIHILNKLKSTLKQDKNIIKKINYINFKDRICFSILNISPITLAILYRLKFLFIKSI